MIMIMIASWLIFIWITIKWYISTQMVLSNCVHQYWHIFCHVSLGNRSNHMYFLCVLLVMALFYDNDYSLTGLTQEGHEVEIQDISSDDEPESNFRLLLEGARALSTSFYIQVSNIEF